MGGGWGRGRRGGTVSRGATLEVCLPKPAIFHSAWCWRDWFAPLRPDARLARLPEAPPRAAPGSSRGRVHPREANRRGPGWLAAWRRAFDYRPAWPGSSPRWRSTWRLAPMAASGGSGRRPSFLTQTFGTQSTRRSGAASGSRGGTRAGSRSTWWSASPSASDPGPEQGEGRSTASDHLGDPPLAIRIPVGAGLAVRTRPPCRARGAPPPTAGRSGPRPRRGRCAGRASRR